MTSYTGYLVETVATLVCVCGVAFVVLYGARRMGIGRPTGPVSLVGHLPLDPRRAVYLITVASKVLVVGVTEGGMTKLSGLEASELPPPPKPQNPFADVLARVMGKAPPSRADDAGAKDDGGAS